MSCLDNIVTISNICDGERLQSLSGLDLMDAPEISPNNLNAIANEEYVKGFTLAQSKLNLAITLVRNDFVAALGANNVVVNITQTVYNSAQFNSQNVTGLSNKTKGQVIYRSNQNRGGLRKIQITQVEVYPQNSGDTFIYIDDDNLRYTYPITVVGGVVNTFKIEHIIQGKYARVLMPNNPINPYSSNIICRTGCNGTVPNDCGYVYGFDGDKEIKTEGFGLNVKFQCVCDYEQILCDLSKSYIGEIVWLKARMNIVEECINTDRFNGWVIYNKEEYKTYTLPKLDFQYREKWQGLMNSMPAILNNYRDSCLNCKGVTWVTNL